MKVIGSDIPDVRILEPKVLADERGWFFESYNKRAFGDATGLEVEFVQDNHSSSRRGVLRGLHYQVRQAQGKLMRVVAGQVFDVAVDLRRSSPTFAKWVGFTLDAASKRMAWIPPGFAHGFLVLSDYAECVYKTTDFYAPQHERTIRWNDATLAIGWPLREEPIVSNKDRDGGDFASADLFG